MASTNVASTPKAQRDALKDLFCTTGGPDWTCHISWNPPAQDVSSWYGVSCDTEGNAVILQLGSNNLTGIVETQPIFCFILKAYQ